MWKTHTTTTTTTALSTGTPTAHQSSVRVSNAHVEHEHAHYNNTAAPIAGTIGILFNALIILRAKHATAHDGLALRSHGEQPARAYTSARTSCIH